MQLLNNLSLINHFFSGIAKSYPYFHIPNIWKCDIRSLYSIVLLCTVFWLDKSPCSGDLSATTRLEFAHRICILFAIGEEVLPNTKKHFLEHCINSIIT